MGLWSCPLWSCQHLDSVSPPVQAGTGYPHRDSNPGPTD